jgi:hypothetical protein
LFNKRLYCSPFKCLNDPYEGTAILSHTLKLYEDEARTISATGKGRPTTIKTSISGGVIIPGAEDLNAWRVCSLSETPSEVRLWSFYGGAHTGLAIAIELDVNSSQSDTGDQGVFKVETYPDLRELHIQEESPDAKMSAKEILTSKTDLWSYEKEYRILSKVSHYPIEGKIKAVILGPRFDRANRKIVERLSGDVPVVASRLDGRNPRVIVPEW